MARSSANPLPIGDTDVKVSCSLKKRGDIYRCQFPDPDTKGKYREVSTGRRTEHEAWVEAAKIVNEAYRPTIRATAKNVTWEIVLEELPTEADLRSRSVEMYCEAVANLKKYVATKGPGDITEEKAKQFRREYESKPYTKSKKEGAKEYKRSPQTVYNALHRLCCLWTHLAKMKYANSNPWKAVPRPKVPKTTRTIATEEEFGKLFAWVDAKGWEIMSVFLRVKAIAGCRTLDLCSVQATQFDPKAATLLIKAEQDKTHADRIIDLPEELAKRLDAIAGKGKGYLWERYTEQAKAIDPRAVDVFTPKLLAWAVRRLFAQYREEFPDRAHITPHDLRARAITAFVKATGSVDAASEFFGVSARTASRHYLDGSKAFDRKENAKKMASLLLPKPVTEQPDQQTAQLVDQHNGASTASSEPQPQSDKAA